MKKNIFFLSFAVFFSCSDKQKDSVTGFELKGRLSNSNGETVYLEQLSADGMKLIDTTAVDQNGEFIFDTQLPETGFYNLKLSNENFATLILDSSQRVMVEGDARDLGNTYKTSGSEDSQLFWEINEASKISYHKRDSLQKVFQTYLNMHSANAKIIDSIDQVLGVNFDQLIEKHNRYLTDFIDGHPNSFASLVAIQQLDAEAHLDYYEKLDNALSAIYPNSSYIKIFHENLLQLKKLAPGGEAPEIKLADPEGNEVALSSLRNKIVLVDFWASWCAPCRAEANGLVTLYKKYKSRGFEIYSVSLDKEKDKWLEAIKKDKMEWTNVSDLQFWNSSVVKQYNFQSIPTTYLINKEGKIISKNLRGAQLESKLAEIFTQ